MSAYEPGKLYLFEYEGKPRQGFYDDLNEGFDHAERFLFLCNVTNPRPAIVLDPEDAAVKRLARFWGDPANKGVGTQFEVARTIAAQITPPEPPMEEPTEWGSRVTDDRDDWVLGELFPRRKWVGKKHGGQYWADMKNPRRHEG